MSSCSGELECFRLGGMGRRAGWSFAELLAMAGRAQGSEGSPQLGQTGANPKPLSP